jgi:ferredoxin
MANLEMWIDRTKCDGHRLCAELFPEMIRLDDWGYPIITPGAIPAALVPHAQRAVDSCPVLALALRRQERKQSGGSSSTPLARKPLGA